MGKNNIWNQITKSLESSLSSSEINTWLSPTQLVELTKDHAIIEVPNKFVASWLNENYIENLKTSFNENLNYLPEIHFTYRESKTMYSNLNHKKRKSGLNKTLNASLILKNFITAKNNNLPCSLALDVVNNPAERYNPLYLFSKTCCGKTHLLNAIGNQVCETDPLAKVIYVSLGKLSSDFSLSKKNGELFKFREKYRNSQMLLIDDIHLITGRENLQKEVISLINFYYETKKQLVVAGKLPPGKIRDLLPELRSRLEGGILSELHAPDHKTRMKIIKKKAKEEKILIPDDAAFFLANATSDLKTLTNHLISLGANTSLNQTEINISTIKSIIKSRPSYELDIYEVQKLTAEHFNISITDLLSSKKTHKFSYPRHVAMYLSRELIGLSFKEIARAFGNKDHSTIIYAVKRITKDKEKKNTVINDLNQLRELLSKGFIK